MMNPFLVSPLRRYEKNQADRNNLPLLQMIQVKCNDVIFFQPPHRISVVLPKSRCIIPYLPKVYSPCYSIIEVVPMHAEREAIMCIQSVNSEKINRVVGASRLTEAVFYCPKFCN